MIIQRLIVEGVGIIGDRISIDFPETGKIGIIGPNESGKSTLFESVLFALYGSKGGRGAGESKEDMITWGKERAFVSLLFSVGEAHYLVERKITRSGRGESTLFGRVVHENETLDESSIIKNGTQATEKIIALTKMDRKSFTKLVFIMQKDLDALRDLSKGSRETLLNNVMGIDEFDSASKMVKDNLKENEPKLELANAQFQMVKQRKDDFQNNIILRDIEKNKLREFENKLEELVPKLEAAQSDVKVYDWLFEKMMNQDKLETLNSSITRIEADEAKLFNLESRKRQLSESAQIFAPKIETLDNLKATYQTVETNLIEAKTKSENLQNRIQSESQKRNISVEDALRFSKNLPSEKRRMLRRTTIFGVLSVVSLALLFVISFAALVIAAIFVLFAAISFSRYSKLDKLFTSTAEFKSLIDQSFDAQKAYSDCHRKFVELVKTEKFRNEDEVSNELISITSQLEAKTGESTIVAVAALIRDLGPQISNLKLETGKQRKNELVQTKFEVEQKIEHLSQMSPANTDGIQYDKDVHNRLKDDFEELSNTINETKTKSGIALGAINTFNIYIEDQRKDAERFPIIEQEVRGLDRREKVLKIVEKEIGQTSQDLRSTVIPYAKLQIFNILPKLTDGRYSDVEINDDLTFQVMSDSTGKYHERELFSGGTQDQFLIALRLAFTQSVLSKRSGVERYALFMDESIASSDESRKHGIFDLLDSLTSTFPQIFIIAHEDISSFVKDYIVLSRDLNGYTTISRKSW